MEIHFSPEAGLIVKDFQGQEAEILASLCYLKQFFQNPDSQAVIDDVMTCILKCTHYAS